MLLYYIIVKGSDTLEKYEARISLNDPIVDQQEYDKDIRYYASYIGQYLGEVYLYLRAKQYNPYNSANPASPPRWIPLSINDNMLKYINDEYSSDNTVKKARVQALAFMNKMNDIMKKKYQANLSDVLKWKKRFSLSHNIAPNGVIIFYYTEYGRNYVYYL